VLVNKAKTLFKMVSLSTSGVSQFARVISILNRIVIGNLLDKWDTLQKFSSSTLLLKTVVYCFELQIMHKQCPWKEGDATFSKAPRLFKTHHGKTFNNWDKYGQPRWPKWWRFGRRLNGRGYPKASRSPTLGDASW
jgi:hypothetical protein